MIVTETEFKTHFGEYLDLLSQEDIFVTRNGKIVAKIVNPNTSAVESISGLLAGELPDDYDAEDLRTERLEKRNVLS